MTQKQFASYLQPEIFGAELSTSSLRFQEKKIIVKENKYVRNECGEIRKPNRKKLNEWKTKNWTVQMKEKNNEKLKLL